MGPRSRLDSGRVFEDVIKLRIWRCCLDGPNVIRRVLITGGRRVRINSRRCGDSSKILERIEEGPTGQGMPETSRR